MSELTKRILFGVPAAAFLLVMAWLGGIPFFITIAVIASASLWEVHHIMSLAGSPGYISVSVLLAAAVWSFAWLPLWTLFAMILILLSLSARIVLKSGNEETEHHSRRWASTLFTGIYAPLGFLMLVQIRNTGEGTEGFWLILTFFLMIWGNDIFAYFGGKSFGKTPLVPHISPKKTREGFWAGFAGAATGFLIVYWLPISFPLPLWTILPAVFIVSLLGPLGDITASRLKRLAGVKDSSSLLPGHGGVFDRFDSMILSAPFIFFLFRLIMNGQAGKPF